MHILPIKQNGIQQDFSSSQTQEVLSSSSSVENKIVPVPSSYGKDLVGRKEKPVSLKIGTSTSGKDIVMDFDRKFIERLRLKFVSDGRQMSLKDVLNPKYFIKSPITTKLPETAISLLSELKQKQPEKYKLVSSVLSQTSLCTKTHQGVSDEYMFEFVKKLSESHPVLLKNVVDNEIPVKIYDDIAAFGSKILHAFFSSSGKQDSEKKQIYQELGFSERNCNGPILKNGILQNPIESMPHELAHAFDYNNGKKLDLTKQDSLTAYLPTQDSLGDDNLRFREMPSFSKEFDDAIATDIIRMSEFDELNGREYGQTYAELLKDEDFQYYLGADEKRKNNKNGQFDDIVTRKELFAQLVSYVTSGSVTNKNFQDRLENLFPNCIRFITQIMQDAEKL